MPKFQDLTGRRFGKLTVIERAETTYGKTRWYCKCDCGKHTVTIAHKLLAGIVKSCGCTRRLTTTHGMTGTRLYVEWQNIKKRCLYSKSESYHKYGGRGISICEEWKNSFESFMDWALSNGYTDELTIERIDVNGNYCPENCKWIPMVEQSKNLRKSLFLEHNGEKKILSDWCRDLNFPYSRAVQRHRKMRDRGKEIVFETIFSENRVRI